MLRQSRAVTAWDLQGADVHLVGSLACGLYYDSRDIDLHVYTDPFDMSAGFAAMGMIASQKGFKGLTCTNLLDAPTPVWNGMRNLRTLKNGCGRWTSYISCAAAATKDILNARRRPSKIC